MSSIHGAEFWLNVDFLALDWATNGIAQGNHPSWFGVALIKNF